MITKGPKGQVYIWPTYRFGPDGEKRLFDKPEDVPAGWGRSPGGSASAELKGGDLPDLAEMKREELEAQAMSEGVDIEAIEGSGKNGNVVMGDIRAAIEEKRKCKA